MRRGAPSMEYRIELARKAAESGKRDEASTEFRKLIDEFPSEPTVLAAVTEFLASVGMLDVADQLYRRALQSAGETPALLLGYSIVLQLQGAADVAERAILAALNQEPENLIGLLTLANLRMNQQRYAEAQPVLEAAARVTPDDYHVRLGQARLAAVRGQRSQAIAHYRKAIETNPTGLEALCELARQASDAGSFAEAQKLFEKARSAHPRHPRPIVGQAEFHVLRGEHEAAAALLRPLWRAGRLGPEGALVMADIAPHTGEIDETIRLLELLIAQPGCSPHNRAMLRTRLGGLYDKAGRLDEAFEAFRSANESLPALPDAEDPAQVASRTRSYFTAEQLAGLPRAESRDRRPIFIVGMPRSGTSLVEQVLSAHSQIHGAGEMPTIPSIAAQLPRVFSSMAPYPECFASVDVEKLNEIQRSYFEALERISEGRPFTTDKLPLNFWHLGLIELLLPGARIIHCQRDPLDTCVSCFMTPLGAGHSYRQRFDTLGAYYRLYRELMDHWHGVISLPMIDVKYEDMVDDLEGQTRRILQFLDLPWEDACLRFYEVPRTTRTASREQVRQPLYRSAIGRADRYARHIGPLCTALGDLARPLPATVE